MDYDLSGHFSEVKEWYDGYRFGDADIYCPWDVINYVDDLMGDLKRSPRRTGSTAAGMIIELKYARTLNELDKACEKALAQIKNRRYDEVLREDGRNDILAYGMVFCKKRCKVVVEKV